MTPEDLDLARSLRDALRGVEGAPEPPAIPAPLLTMLQWEGREAGLSRARWSEPWKPAWLCSTAGAPDWLPDLTHDARAATLLDLLPHPWAVWSYPDCRKVDVITNDTRISEDGPTLTIAAARAVVAWREGV